VQREGDASAATIVPWMIQPVTAGNPADFGGPLSGELAFEGGQSSAVLNIPIAGDTLEEPDEILRLWLRPDEDTGIAAGEWVPVQSFPAVSGPGFDRYAAIGENLMAARGVFGAPWAFIWRRGASADPAGWTPVALPVLPAPPAGYNYTASGIFAVNGWDIAVVRGLQSTGGTLQQTRLFVYQLNPGTGQWTLQMEQQLADPGASSAALSGDRVAVGLAGLGFDGTTGGAVDTWTRTGGVWSPGPRISAPPTVTLFGERVLLHGDSMAIMKTGGGSLTCYFHRFAGGAWQPEGSFTGPLVGEAVGGFDGESILSAGRTLVLRRRDAGGVWNEVSSVPLEPSLSGVGLVRNGRHVSVLATSSQVQEVSLLTGKLTNDGLLPPSLAARTVAATGITGGGTGFVLSGDGSPPPAPEWYERGVTDGTLRDDDGQAIFIPPVTAAEPLPGTGQTAALEFRLYFKRALSVPMTLDVTATPGTASADADFTPVQQRLTVPAGQWVWPVSIPVIADNQIEEEEALTLQATPVDSSGAPGAATGFIADAGPVMFEPVAINSTEGDAGTQPVDLPVRLRAAPAEPVTVPLRRWTSATEGTDFTGPAPSSASFAAGLQETRFSYSIAGDLTPESNESIHLGLPASTAPPVAGLPWAVEAVVATQASSGGNFGLQALTRDKFVSFTDTTARVWTRRSDGAFISEASLTGIPANHTYHSDRAAACQDLIALLVQGNTSNYNRILLWTKSGTVWSLRIITPPDADYASIQLQPGWMALRNSNRGVIVYGRHAGGANAWGQVWAASASQSPGDLRACGPDWMAFAASSANHPDGTLRSGEMHIYRVTGHRDRWCEPHTVIRPAAPLANMLFGNSVSASDNTLVVRTSVPASGDSDFHIFRRDEAGTWIADPVVRSRGGLAAVAGDWFALLEPYPFSGGGRVAVFSRRRDTGVWQPELTVAGNQNGLGPLTGGTAFVGSTLLTHSSLNGQAYVFAQALSTLAIADDDPAPVMVINDAVASERDPAAIVTFQLTGTIPPGDVTLNMEVTGDTALAGRDFTIPASMTVMQGLPSGSFSVPLVRDQIMEREESFLVSIVSASAGKIARRTARVVIVDDDIDPARSSTLAAPDSLVRWTVPSQGTYVQPWKETEFDDSGWNSGTGGIGFDLDSGGISYLSLIGSNTQTAMYNISGTALCRQRFQVDAVPQGGLLLRLQCDDAAAVWLNGTPFGVTPRVPAALNYNSTATDAATDRSGGPLEDLVQSTALLRQGENVLACHGLNRTAGGSDFLLRAQLYNTRPWPQSYLDWISQSSSGLTAQTYGPLADADSDGSSNLMEWVAGTPPRTAGFQPVLILQQDGDRLVLSVTLATLLPPGVVCRLEGAASLSGPWDTVFSWPDRTPAAGYLELPAEVPDPDHLRWRIQLPPGSDRPYYRLAAVLQE